MRHLKLRFSIVSLVLLVACAVAGALFGLAGSGGAASPNVCATPTNPSTGTFASCVTQNVMPHKANVGKFSQSVLRFKDEGTSTASHVSLQTAFNPAVTVDSFRLLLNGVVQSTSTCTVTSTSVRCSDFANFAPGDVGKLVVRFTSSTPVAVTVTSTAFYAESGNDKPGGPNGTRNDAQQARPEIVNFVDAAAPASGDCTSAGTTVIDGNALQSTTVAYNATSDPSLLCSPGGAAVEPTQPGLVTLVSVVEIAAQAAPGYATAFIDYTPMPTNTKIKTIVLKENTALNGDFSTWITVQPCDATTGLPSNPGLPEPGARDSTPHHNDTCIPEGGRTNLPMGGGRLTLRVIANPFDGRYGS